MIHVNTSDHVRLEAVRGALDCSGGVSRVKQTFSSARLVTDNIFRTTGKHPLEYLLMSHYTISFPASSHEIMRRMELSQIWGNHDTEDILYVSLDLNIMDMFVYSRQDILNIKQENTQPSITLIVSVFCIIITRHVSL